MHNLILDFGNTLYKGAIFDDSNLLFKFSGTKMQIQDLVDLKTNYPNIRKVILSSVIEIPAELLDFLHTNFDFQELTHQTPLPIINLYETPETLGKDRLAAVVGAFQLFPNQNVLIVDAGSSITYDMITKEGHYLGGGISLGIEMRFKALHHFTKKLPLIVDTEAKTELIGKTTRDSILSGVLNGVCAEVDGIINQYKQKFPDLLVLITGGNLKHFDKNLKNNIFAAENLVLQGLNFILNYNDKKQA
ncbi:MAG TPA: type III pantothenate kinase [Bacteroidales bacterium]|nr:type III pantothenate kinase [Bacteroidales bacterium]